MPQKKQTKGKKVKSDMVTIPYSMVVFYVLIGLIIGMALGALALLWVAHDQSLDLENAVAENNVQSQILYPTIY